MRKVLSRYPKAEIATLPRACFEGRIITIQNEGDAEKAVDYLLSRSILGFDTETKPNFTPGKLNAVALLQVCDGETCFLFRLNQIGLPDCVVRLLSDQEVLKIGLSWHDDIRMLHHRREFQSGTFVELQSLVREFGIMDMSLQKLYANIFGQKISKSQQLSNWEADVLKDPQKTYAATDAWACVMLYQELQRMKEEGYELEVVPEPEGASPQPTPEGGKVSPQPSSNGKGVSSQRSHKEKGDAEGGCRRKPYKRKKKKTETKKKVNNTEQA